jgi:hypothetical protein
MAAPELPMWFAYVAGDCTAAAKEAGYTAEYDAEDNETTVVVYAHLAETVKNIAGHLGTVLNWVQIKEATA